MHAVKLPKNTFRAPETAEANLNLLKPLRDFGKHQLAINVMCAAFAEA